MNPDYEDKGTTDYNTWKIKLGNVVVVFKVYSYGMVEIRHYTDGVEDTKSICHCDKDTAREKWHSYTREGFILVGFSKSRPERTRRKKQRVKSAMTGYDKLKMDAKRKEERNKDVMKSIHASMDDFVKSYKKQCAKEAYDSFKKYKNYALEA